MKAITFVAAPFFSMLDPEIMTKLSFMNDFNQFTMFTILLRFLITAISALKYLLLAKYLAFNCSSELKN